MVEWKRNGTDEPLTFMDGFDDCIIGICERYGQPAVVAYDTDKVLEKLQADGMTYEEAVEFFAFNQIGAWVGDTTPVFVTLGPVERDDEQVDA